jgi:hypothetical protein
MNILRYLKFKKSEVERPKPSAEWLEKQRLRWLEITGRYPEPKIDLASLRIAIDPLLLYKVGQIRYRNDGVAAIYMSAETAANQSLADAIIEHEVAHFRFSRNKPYGIFKVFTSPYFERPRLTLVGLSLISFGIIPTIAPQFPAEFANNPHNFWWFIVVNGLAAIGVSVIFLGLVRFPLTILDSIRCQVEELFADRAAVRAGHRNGVLDYIDSCSTRWWHFPKTHPTKGLRRFFAEKVWNSESENAIQLERSNAHD